MSRKKLRFSFHYLPINIVKLTQVYMDISKDSIMKITGGDAFIVRDLSNIVFESRFENSTGFSKPVSHKLETPSFNETLDDEEIHINVKYIKEITGGDAFITRELSNPSQYDYIPDLVPRVVTSNRGITSAEVIPTDNGSLIELTGGDSFYVKREATRPSYILDTFHAEQSQKIKAMENLLKNHTPSLANIKGQRISCDLDEESFPNVASLSTISRI